MNLVNAPRYELDSQLNTAARMISRYATKKPAIAEKWMNIQAQVRGEIARRRREYNAEKNCMVNV
mgnify:CR=1 FL=1